MNVLSIILILGGLSLSNCIVLAQSRVYDPCFRLTTANAFYFSQNTINNNFLHTNSDLSYGIMLNNSFNIGKQGAISIGLSYARIGGNKYRKISFASFPVMFHKYFNPQRNKINVAVTINPGVDLSDDSRPMLNFGYSVGYRLKKHGNIGVAFEMDTVEVDRIRMMHLSLFYEYYFF